MEDDSTFGSFPRPTTRLGVDGSWVGANHGESYFYITVNPGEHHLCASWQSWFGFGMRETSAAAYFTAEPGQTYDFRVHNIWLTQNSVTHVDLSPLDSDEGPTPREQVCLQQVSAKGSAEMKGADSGVPRQNGRVALSTHERGPFKLRLGGDFDCAWCRKIFFTAFHRKNPIPCDQQPSLRT